MTPEQEHRANEARRLLNEPLLKEAMDAVKTLARDELCAVDPANIAEISRLQAIANNTEEIRQWLIGLTLAVKPTGFDPNAPAQTDPGS